VTFFVGTFGNVKLKRTTTNKFESSIDSADVNTALNRIGFDGSLENILTGDRISISTNDARGLVCFPAGAWPSAAVQNTFDGYVNVNQVGGLRFFASFADAVNNVRANEIAVASFAGNSLPITVGISDVSYNLLGNVNGYTFNSEREQIDTTVLSDKFRRQFSAGLLSGSGTIDCFFDYTTTGVKETPLFMLQLLQRLDLGSEFQCALYLTDKAVSNSLVSVYYEFNAMITRSGVAVLPGEVTNCTLDFVTTGDIALKVGEPSGYVLQEDDFKVQFEQSVEFLLQESED
jgi:hypothetical protein